MIDAMRSSEIEPTPLQKVANFKKNNQNLKKLRFVLTKSSQKRIYLKKTKEF